MHPWLMLLGQAAQAVDVTTAAGMVALGSMHLHTAWQTIAIKRHVEREIDAKVAKHVKERHS